MDNLETKFVEFYKEVGQSMGCDDLLSTIMALLYIEPEEIAMDDLAKRTGYSLASISNKIKVLEISGMVTRKTKPKSRRVFLHMEKDFLAIIKTNLIKKNEYVIKKAKIRIPVIIKENKNKVKTQKEKEKLKILEKYLDQILKFEKVINEMVKSLEKIQND